MRAAGFAVAILALAIALPSRAQRGSEVVIGASGDVLVQPRVVSAARAAVDGFDRVVAPLRLVAHSGEIAFANLESPLSEEIPVTSGSPPTLGAPADLAGSLARAGIDVVSLANNHAWDQGARGAALTAAAVHDAGIVGVGAGSDEETFTPRVIVRGGVRVAFVAVTERVNAGPGDPALRPRASVAVWDDARVADALTRARSLADLVVVSIHWSHDFWDGPREEQRERARFLVDHGADVVLGHGPHVLHAVERMTSPRGDAVCAYSLGNLVSNQGFAYLRGHVGLGHEATWRPDTRDGAWLRVRASVGERIAIGALEAVPLFTYNNYHERDAGLEPVEDIRVQRLADVADARLRRERREAIATALGPDVTLVDR
jgi:poly-gamma-glutamate synthesis protein (capsule biosynthesis protein)